jgi:hypothetical protein
VPIKNIVEARLKGPGMHWERKNVNPMLALRNAICNDRWREIWQKALRHHRKLQAHQRSARVKQRAQAFLAAGDALSQESLLSLSAAAASQPVSEAKSPSVTSPPPVPAAPQPSSCRLSSRRKQHTARNRVKYSHQRVGEVSGETCVCGTPLVQSIGGRTRQFCSNGCRQRAYRERQAQMSCASA